MLVIPLFFFFLYNDTHCSRIFRFRQMFHSNNLLSFLLIISLLVSLFNLSSKRGTQTYESILFLNILIILIVIN